MRDEIYQQPPAESIWDRCHCWNVWRTDETDTWGLEARRKTARCWSEKRQKHIWKSYLMWAEHRQSSPKVYRLRTASYSYVDDTIWHKTKRVPTDVPCCKIPLFQDRWDNSLHTNPPPSCQPGDDPTDARPSLRVNYMRLNVFTQSAVDSCNVQTRRQFVLISDSCVVFLSEHVILPSSLSLIQLACVCVCRFLPFTACAALAITTEQHVIRACAERSALLRSESHSSF